MSTYQKKIIVIDNRFKNKHQELVEKLKHNYCITVVENLDYTFSKELIKEFIKYDGVKYDGTGLIKKQMVSKVMDMKNVEMLRDYIYHEQEKYLNVPLYLYYNSITNEIYALEYGDEAITSREDTLISAYLAQKPT